MFGFSSFHLLLGFALGGFGSFDDFWFSLLDGGFRLVGLSGSDLIVWLCVFSDFCRLFILGALGFVVSVC